MGVEGPQIGRHFCNYIVTFLRIQKETMKIVERCNLQLLCVYVCIRWLAMGAAWRRGRGAAAWRRGLALSASRLRPLAMLRLWLAGYIVWHWRAAAAMPIGALSTPCAWRWCEHAHLKLRGGRGESGDDGEDEVLGEQSGTPKADSLYEEVADEGEMQDLAVSTLSATMRARRIVGRLKECDEVWMKAWMQSCADALADCGAEAGAGAEATCEQGRNQIRKNTLSVMQVVVSVFCLCKASSSVTMSM